MLEEDSKSLKGWTKGPDWADKFREHDGKIRNTGQSQSELCEQGLTSRGRAQGDWDQSGTLPQTSPYAASFSPHPENHCPVQGARKEWVAASGVPDRERVEDPPFTPHIAVTVQS